MTDKAIDQGVDVDQTLAELVDRLPGSTRVLEAYGLDYCCGGQRPLSDECERVGVSLGAVCEALGSLPAGPPPAWVAMDPGEMVDHLEATHHRYLHGELPRLDALAEKVASVHGGRHPELLEVLADVKELRDDLEPHLLKEERVLFPMIRELCSTRSPVASHGGSLRNPISVMLVEHDRAGALLAALRRHAGDFVAPDDACASYRALFEGLEQLEADTHLHVHKENNLLFPAVVELEDRAGVR